MHQVKYGLFFDNHTQMENPDVGRDFDPEYFTDQLLACGVDYLAFHARCNVGMAYYDTKIGTRHPSLDYDLFGRLAECCAKKHIALVAYLNGGISTMELVQHPEWETRYFPGTGSFGEIGPYSHTVCYNSPFREHITSMIREIATNYPVEGFFIDCLGSYPCICNHCVSMMKERGIDFRSLDEVTKFSHQSVLSYCDDIIKTVKEVIPDPMLYFNGPVFGEMRDRDTFFDCECLPTASWGYEYLPLMAHMMHNIKPGTQLLNMTGRFYDWGDFGGLRPAESLKFDLHYGLAFGMRPNIGGHFHPRGDRDQAVFDRIREVYDSLRVYEDWYTDAVNLADIALVYPADDQAIRLKPTFKSAVRMLDELKMQFDVVFADCDKSWDQYKLLILPENVTVSDQLAERIRRHVSRGGAFFACGKEAAEKLGPELGIVSRGDSGLDPAYFKMRERFSAGIDDMFLSIYAPAARAETAGAAAEAMLVKPYYNRGWAGTHALFYTPPDKETDMPFLTSFGSCVWCAGEIFSGYAKRGALHLRDIVRNVILELVDKPLVKVVKLPALVRLVVTGQSSRLNVHLTAYAPEKRAQVPVVEDPVSVLDGEFKLLTGDRKITSVTLAPDRTPVQFSTENGYTTVKLPPFTGFALVSLE